MSEAPSPSLETLTRAAVDAIGPLLAQLKREADAALAKAGERIAALEAEVRQLNDRAAAVPRDGRDGKDGRDGHDATFREPVAYEPEKAYPQGAVACHRGGVWYAARATNGAPGAADAGWTLIVAGLASLKFDQQDDARGFALELEWSDGTHSRFAFALPTLVYRGVWKAGSYGVGDAVTWDGSLWIARRATDQKPGPVVRGSESWQLAVKKGTDGKNGAAGSDAPAFRGFYDPGASYPPNAIVRTASGLWLTRRATADPPPADARENENANWRCFLPAVTQ